MAKASSKYLESILIFCNIRMLVVSYRYFLHFIFLEFMCYIVSGLTQRVDKPL